MHNDYLAQILSAAMPQGFRGRMPDQLRGGMGGFTSQLQQLPFMQGVPQAAWQQLGGMPQAQQAPAQPPAQQTPMANMQTAAPSPMQTGGSPMQSFAATGLQQFGGRAPGMRRGGFGGFGALGQGFRRQNPLVSRTQQSTDSYY